MHSGPPMFPRGGPGAILLLAGLLAGLLAAGLVLLALLGVSPVLLACEVLPFLC